MSGPDGGHSRSSSSSYLALLNSLANDLDLMLNDLYAQDDLAESSTSKLRGDSFLEPYLNGISSDGNSSLDTSPLLSDNRRSLSSPNQNSAFQWTSVRPASPKNVHRTSLGHDNRGYGESPVFKEQKSKEAIDSDRQACLEDIEALSIQNKQQLNEILKLASRREVVSTSRSGHLIHRRSELEAGGPASRTEDVPLVRKCDLNDNTSDENLSQGEGDLSGSEDAGSEESDFDECDSPCGIALMERLIRSHPVWFLPGIQRTGAVHLLQGKEQGNFVVRQSSQPDTMAISVRLPPGKGPYIEHYLIQAHGSNLSLESSENMFDSIPKLICHYAQCCDELPVQLTLPRPIRDAKNRQQLSSLALLGQEFWRYPMAHPKNEQSVDTSPSSSICSFGSLSNNNKLERSAIVLDLSPVMSTFKSVPERNEKPTRPSTLLIPSSSPPNLSVYPTSGGVRSTPSGRTPPQPPPRWAKPSPSPPDNNQVSITTTVTFTMQEMQVQSIQVTPNNNNSLPGSDAEPSVLSSPGSEHSLPFTSAASPPTQQSFQNSSRLNTLVSPISDTTNLVSKGFQKIENSRSLVSTPTEKNSRNRKLRRGDRRESQHYRAFDILKGIQNCETEQAEDTWTGESLRTFKPDLKKPDLIERLGRSSADLVESNESGEKKQTSPFYAEPADSLKTDVVLRGGSRGSVGTVRHSDPSHFAQWSNSPYISALSKIESRTELVDSRSADNILKPNGGIVTKKNLRAKAVQPPRVTNKVEPSWTVDSSWEFIAQEEGGVCGGRFPSIEQQMESEHRAAGCVTVRHIIAQRFPHLRLEPTVEPRKTRPLALAPSATLCSRVSAYDNLGRRDVGEESESETILSEQWDTQPYENVLVDCESESTIRVGGDAVLDTEDDETVFETPKKPLMRGKSFRDRLDPLLSPPRLQALRGKDQTGVGVTIRSYALHLASDKSTTFAKNIDNFIACTLEAKESNPQVVMRNMRQFMSGMKNYLVKHGEKEFEKHVQLERMKLKSTEFLNLDAILESVMHKLVVRPLKPHLYKLFVDEYTKSGAIQVLHENILYARTKPLTDLGIRAKIVPPSEEALQNICDYISNLQEMDSPLDKLQCLLTCIAAIFNSVKSCNDRKPFISLGADDFLPLFVWVLVQSGFIGAEIEAEYMWGLLHPSLLSGEGGYYLTTLSSAVHVLKSFKSCQMQLSPSAWNGRDSLLKIVVPDELHGSILTTTLPIRPHMTTKDVTKILAHKVRITNPQDYGLFKLVDGEETLLGDNESPQDVKAKVMESGKHCMLAFKRIDAKIAWPNT